MIELLRRDSVALDKTYFTEGGYLIDNPIVTCCGVFEYQAEDGSIRREARLPEHVFCPKSLASYKGKPIILTHQTSKGGLVDKDNVREEIVGTILSEGYRDGDNVRAEIVLHDIDLVKQFPFRELSLSYIPQMEIAAGEYRGQPYDEIQTNIVINNLAIVSKARAGEHARLNLDGEKGGEEMSEEQNGKKERPDCSEIHKKVTELKGKYDGRYENPDKKFYEDMCKMFEVFSGLLPDDAGLYADQFSKACAYGDEAMIEEVLRMYLGEATDEVLDEAVDVFGDIIDGYSGAEIYPGCGTDEYYYDKEYSEIEGYEDPTLNTLKEQLEIMKLGELLGLEGLERLSVLGGKKVIAEKVLPGLRMDSAARISVAYDIAKSQLAERRSLKEQYEAIRADGAKPRVALGSRQAQINMMNELFKGGNE